MDKPGKNGNQPGRPRNRFRPNGGNGPATKEGKGIVINIRLRVGSIYILRGNWPKLNPDFAMGHYLQSVKTRK